jgi:dihydropteroate synthase
MAPHPERWLVGSRDVLSEGRTLVMGVLNVTPDSFSDGGRFDETSVAVDHGVRMVEEGADLLDVGGESTRPGSDRVPSDVESARVIPVIEALAARVDIPISIDTRKSDVARTALAAGATIVNDISGGADPGMFDAVARAEAGMILMHMRGDPKDMQQRTDYDDVVAEVRDVLAGLVEAAVSAGIDRDRVAVDPGLGFAKTFEQNLELMRNIDALAAVRRPLVVGPSRKSFIGRVTGTEVDDRAWGTAGAAAWLAGRGAQVIRVHDVREMVHVLRVVDAIRGARLEEPAESA